MSDIIWSINPDNDNLQQTLVRMKNYATEVAEAKEVAMNWKEEGNLSKAQLSMEQRKHFYLLFKEVMNNAINHAAAKNITIQIVSTDHLVSLLITDDGKGFDTASISSGNGLKNMHRPTALLNGTVFIDMKNVPVLQQTMISNQSYPVLELKISL